MRHTLEQSVIKSYKHILLSFIMYIFLFKIEKYVFINYILYYKMATIQFSTYFLSIAALITYAYDWFNVLLYMHESKFKCYFLNFCAIFINSILFYPIIKDINITLLEWILIILIITIETYTIHFLFKFNMSIIIKILMSVIFILFITEFSYIIFLKFVNKNIFKVIFDILQYSIVIIICLYTIFNNAFQALKIFYNNKEVSNINYILIFTFLINCSIILSIINLIIFILAYRNGYSENNNITIYNKYNINNITNNFKNDLKIKNTTNTKTTKKIKQTITSNKNKITEKLNEDENNKQVKKITKRKTKSDDTK